MRFNFEAVLLPNTGDDDDYLSFVDLSTVVKLPVHVAFK